MHFMSVAGIITIIYWSTKHWLDCQSLNYCRKRLSVRVLRGLSTEVPGTRNSFSLHIFGWRVPIHPQLQKTQGPYITYVYYYHIWTMFFFTCHFSPVWSYILIKSTHRTAMSIIIFTASLQALGNGCEFQTFVIFLVHDLQISHKSGNSRHEPLPSLWELQI